MVGRNSCHNLSGENCFTFGELKRGQELIQVSQPVQISSFQKMLPSWKLKAPLGHFGTHNPHALHWLMVKGL
jgi:hypothetical protein